MESFVTIVTKDTPTLKNMISTFVIYEKCKRKMEKEL